MLRLLALLLSLCQAHILSGRALPQIPMMLPEPTPDKLFRLKDKEGDRPLTLVEPLQKGLKTFLSSKGDPIAAVVLAEVQSGKILAMVQGKDPKSWGAEQHTALHPGFPAASLFKIPTTVAALELQVKSDYSLPLFGGCGEVRTQSMLLHDTALSKRRARLTSLSTAFADSCNNFYASMALQRVGLGPILDVANHMGWGEQNLSADFEVSGSPLLPPTATHSDIRDVGRYAAGFGPAGLSPAHGAWLSLMIANHGEPTPLVLFADTARVPLAYTSKPIYSQKTGTELLEMMQKTVRSGTAAGVFKNRLYRKFRLDAGGKTGTLKSVSPEGLGTWFIGLYPVSAPKVVVSAVVVNSDRWVIKGSQLAAEALRQWYDFQHREATIVIKPTIKSKSPLSKSPLKSRNAATSVTAPKV